MARQLDVLPAEALWRRHLPAGAGFRVADLLAGGTLPGALRTRWQAAPDAPALLDAAGHLDDPEAGRWVPAGALEERSRMVATRLLGLGLSPGDRLLAVVPPACDRPVEWVVAVVAALRAGLVLVPANAVLTGRELDHLLADAAPAAVMCDGAHPVASDRRGAAPAPLVLRTDGVPHGGRTPSDDAGAPGILDAASPESIALVVYTSGTTGRPKGAVLTHANLLAGCQSLVVAWRLAPDDRLVHALPLSHVHGLCVGVLALLLAGSSIVLTGGFEADAVLAASRRHRATLFFGVPTMYHRLVAAPDADELARLRLAVCGSAPLPAALHAHIRATTGAVVLERYGMTETLLTVSNPVDGERVAGTIGFALPGVEVALARDDGEAAELYVRGPSVSDGYWSATAGGPAARGTDWFPTGDLVAADAEGRLRVLGRAGDLVISGGYNVYPAEVEEVLALHPSVGEVAVTGTPSDEWGETVTAWVVPAGPGFDAAALLEWAAAYLAPYKRPRAVRVVDALPRTALGKVRRGGLR